LLVTLPNNYDNQDRSRNRPAATEEQIVSPAATHLQDNLSAVDRRKRDDLRRLVKQNTRCSHSSIYSQISFICRRLAVLHESNKISTEQALDLTLQAHDQLSHKGLQKDVVAEQLHKALDKLQKNGDTSRLAIIMANTNSSVHARDQITEMKKKTNSDLENRYHDKYSESYWADVI
jgi:hypothetical protein